MTVKELFNFIKGVRPGFAFTDAQLTVWLNEIEGHVQTDIWLLEPAVDETQTGLVEYDSTIDTETGEMVDANHELLVPFPWNKLYRYFLLMSIDLANGEYQRYANSYELFNEAYEEYAGWYAQHVSPANGDAITRGYYISAYQFAARGGYAGTEEEFYETLGGIGTIEQRVIEQVDAEIEDLTEDVRTRLGSSTVYNVQNYGILPDTGEDLYDALFDFLHGDVSTTGGVVYFPVGQYIISDTLLIPANTIFLGEGRGTEIKYTGAAAIAVALANGGDNVGIANMTVNDKNTAPQGDGAIAGGIGFSTYDFNKWTTKHSTASAISPHRDTANLFAENIWSDSGYVLQTEEPPATEERLLGTIQNVRYRNIIAPHSRVSLYGRQNVTNAVIENVVCAYLRVGNTSTASNLRGLADVNVKNVTAGRVRICARNANVDGLVIDPAYKYDTITDSYAVLLSSGDQDVFTSHINLSNSRIDATGYDYAFQKGNADVSMVNVSCKNYNISAWHEEDGNNPSRFVNCDFNSECDLAVPTNRNASTIHGVAVNSTIIAGDEFANAPVLLLDEGESVTIQESAVSEMPLDALNVDICGYQCGLYDEVNKVSAAESNIRKLVGYTSTIISIESEGTITSYTINFPQEAGIVYGGTLDATHGKLTVTRRLITFTGDEGFGDDGPNQLIAPSGGDYLLRYRLNKTENWKTAPIAGSGACSHYNVVAVTRSDTNIGYYPYASSSVKALQFRNSVIAGSASTSDYGPTIAWLQGQYNNGTPLQVWYELSEPEVYTVEPIEIKSSVGMEIYASSGNVSIKYWSHHAGICELPGGGGDGIRAAQTIKNAMQPFTPLFTIPKSGGGNFTIETPYEGIPYSAMNWAARDVLYDMSVESIFTAFRNPYSDLYSYDYTVSNPDPLKNDSGASAHVWAGAVCSTWVSWATNRPIRYTTTGILDRLIKKEISCLEDLNIGDAMYQTGHVALITGIKYKGGAVVSINVSEMWKPTFRNVWYTPSEWWDRYYDGGTKDNPGPKPFLIGRFQDNYSIRTFEPIHLVDNCITERGDNVYAELNSDIWVFIKEGTNRTLVVIDPDGVHETVDYTTLPQKTIAGLSVPVYNMRDVLNDVGQWRIRDYGSRYESRIKIINIGAVIPLATEDSSGKTNVTLTGYNSSAPLVTHGCKLHSFQVLRMHKDYSSDSYIYPVPDDALANGYVSANGTDQTLLHATITEAPFTINTSAAHSADGSWYVRVYFDTGCGLAHIDTNSIMAEDRT